MCLIITQICICILISFFQILNKRCVEAEIKTALSLGARVNKVSRINRKYYYYPDLLVSLIMSLTIKYYYLTDIKLSLLAYMSDVRM